MDAPLVRRGPDPVRPDRESWWRRGRRGTLRKVRQRDTNPESHSVQMRVVAMLPPERRVELAWEMSEQARELADDGIRRRHPEYDDTAARLALYRLLLGTELFRAAWPEAAQLDP